jgi:hypothetical protein
VGRSNFLIRLLASPNAQRRRGIREERSRARTAAYRDRQRNPQSTVIGNVTGNASPKSDHAVPEPR